MTAYQNSLKILSLTIQSVNSKKESLWELLNDQDLDIFCLYKFWISLNSEIIPSPPTKPANMIIPIVMVEC